MCDDASNVNLVKLKIRVKPNHPKFRFCDVYWNRLITELLCIQIKLEFEQAYCTTIGGAWATLQKLQYSKDYAVRQYRAAKKLNDRSMMIKSQLYIALYHIHVDQFQKAQSIIAEQEKEANQLQDEHILGYISFVKERLDRKMKEFNVVDAAT
eukprot:TRINITY_DN1649_c0_g1_i2.p1 TRINITY_DN1649_c0_g1~~TRINITY_DN1649_c0_g1_i2.p1  ORF type:complete len:153 (-),score=18.58 TRINITY_DN1649_c0_g1_i2:74-532(-)